MATSRHLAANQHHLGRDPHARRTPDQHDQELAPILGTWQITGADETTAIVGEETFERMPGGFFVHGRFDRMIDGDAHDGVIVLGYDRDRGAFVSHHFDNLGYAREYVITIEGARWTFHGRYERATYDFDGAHFAATWEQSKDGRTWQPLCKLRGTRVRGA